MRYGDTAFKGLAGTLSLAGFQLAFLPGSEVIA
jgi:hypothetical protein